MCEYCEENPRVLAWKTESSLFGETELRLGVDEDYIELRSYPGLKVPNGEHWPLVVMRAQIWYCPICGRKLKNV